MRQGARGNHRCGTAFAYPLKSFIKKRGEVMKNRYLKEEMNPFVIRRMVLEKNHEELVHDERDRFRPSELIQRKLQSITPSDRLAVSCLHAGRTVHRPGANN
jgi:hypothetical protein